MSVADPEQLARNILYPLLNPSQSLPVVSASVSATSSVPTVATAPILHIPRRTSALDLLLMTEGEARHLSETMLAGSSLAPSLSSTGTTAILERSAVGPPIGLQSTMCTFSTSASTSAAQVFTFAGASSTGITDMNSPSSAVYRVGLSSAPASTATAGSSTPTDFQAGFRRSEAAKCRRVYGAVNKSRWCKQCRWKKACTRFQGPSPHHKEPPDLTWYIRCWPTFISLAQCQLPRHHASPIKNHQIRLFLSFSCAFL